MNEQDAARRGLSKRVWQGTQTSLWEMRTIKKRGIRETHRIECTENRQDVNRGT